MAVCGSKDCRTRDGYADLLRELTASGQCQLVDSRCLDICSGPVVVVDVGAERARVFRKVRRPKQRRDLVRLVVGRPMSDRLRRLQVTGSTARRARRRIRPR